MVIILYSLLFQDGRSSTKWYTYQKRREKIFDKTDGEYVEFEEIKEEK